jgi:hypothetical protein
VLLKARNRVGWLRLILVIEAGEPNAFILIKQMNEVELFDGFELCLGEFLGLWSAAQSQEPTMGSEPLVYFGSCLPDRNERRVRVLRSQRKGLFGLEVGPLYVGGYRCTVPVGVAALHQARVFRHVFHGSTVTVWWNSEKIKLLNLQCSPGELVLRKNWRRERDSNPRDGYPPTHFPGVRLRPLGHLSAARAAGLAAVPIGAGASGRTIAIKNARARDQRPLLCIVFCGLSAHLVHHGRTVAEGAGSSWMAGLVSTSAPAKGERCG